MFRLFDNTTRSLEVVIEGSKLRHQLVTNNLANADTPDFQSLDLDFQSALREQLGEKNSELDKPKDAQERFKRLENKKFIIGTKRPLSDRSMRAKVLAESNDKSTLDNNSVDIDRETSKLVENSFFHRSYIELLNRKHRMLKEAISGRV